MAVRATGVDAGGIELSIRDRDGVHAVRVDFDHALARHEPVGPAVLGLVERARRSSGEPGETSGERELARIRAVRTFSTTVRAVSDVHRYLRLVTLGGGDLAAFSPLGPDTFVYVMPSEPSTPVTWSSWVSAADRPPGAYYTVRTWRPDRAEIDLLVVRHDRPGVVSSWASGAEPGQPVTLWGPRDSFESPVGASWCLLVADDTGVPAVAAILEQLDPAIRAFVVAEVDGADAQPPLPERDGVHVSWVYRRGQPAGTAPELLLDAVRALTLPPGSGYVWGGAEHAAIAAIRRHVGRELGLPRARRSLAAYWHADR